MLATVDGKNKTLQTSISNDVNSTLKDSQGTFFKVVNNLIVSQMDIPSINFEKIVQTAIIILHAPQVNSFENNISQDKTQSKYNQQQKANNKPSEIEIETTTTTNDNNSQNQSDDESNMSWENENDQEDNSPMDIDSSDEDEDEDDLYTSKDKDKQRPKKVKKNRKISVGNKKDSIYRSSSRKKWSTK